MIPLLAPALLALASAQDAPCRKDPVGDAIDRGEEADKPVERSGPGLWIGGIAFEARDIQSAAAEQNSYTDEWEIHLIFTASGKDKFGDAQHCGVGYPIEISFEGAVVSHPRLNEVIQGNEVQIAGGFTQASAADLAARIAPPG